MSRTGRTLVIALAVVGLATGCSTSAEIGQAAPTTGPTATLRPTATVAPTPTPSPTPLPRGDDVVADTRFDAGGLELEVSVGPTEAAVFSGGFVSSAEAVELAFAFDDFLGLVSLVSPDLASDPLVAQADEVLAGPWRVRVVGEQVFVQQAALVAAAEGEDGDWVVVEDASIVELLRTGGVLGGGLDHGVVVELVRSGTDVMSPVEAPMPPATAAYDAVVDGAAVSVAGLDAPASAGLIGIESLHLVQAPVRVWTLDDVLIAIRLEIPVGGFAEASPPAVIELRYTDRTGELELGVPDDVVTLAAS